MSCESVPQLEGPVAVLGAGTMGRGIAHVAALAGFETRLFDIESSILNQAVEAVRANLDKGVALGKVDAADRDGALSRFSASTDLKTALDGVGLAVEAVPERLDLKKSVLRSVTEHVLPTTIIASNTSEFSGLAT